MQLFNNQHSLCSLSTECHCLSLFANESLIFWYLFQTGISCFSLVVCFPHYYFSVVLWAYGWVTGEVTLGSYSKKNYGKLENITFQNQQRYRKWVLLIWAQQSEHESYFFSTDLRQDIQTTIKHVSICPPSTYSFTYSFIKYLQSARNQCSSHV